MSRREQLSIGELTVTDKLKVPAGRPVVQGTLSFPMTTLTALTSAATVTYTAAQVLGGFIVDTISQACAASLPTPASIVAAIPGCVVGTSFEFDVKNTAASAIAITLTANGSSTYVGTATINQSNAKRVKAVITNIGAGTEAVVFYSMGSYAF